MTTRVDMIIETLKAHPNRRFTARELARLFLERYPKEMTEKKKKRHHPSEEDLLNQLAAEIGGGGNLKRAKKRHANIRTQDHPRPRVCFWVENPSTFDAEQAQRERDDEPPSSGKETNLPTPPAKQARFTEHDLYPQLIEFLHEDMALHCMRIDERKSRNSHGSRGNHWLHPDVVALQTLDAGWSETVRTCVQNSGDAPIRLWSFEVKKHLSRSNVRECFFQTVSNSTWANHAYLVTAGLNDDVEAELNMLCALHGIGVLLLDTGSLFDSQILIPARERSAVDWQSADRIVRENSDFETFIENVNGYISRRKIIKKHWNL